MYVRTCATNLVLTPVDYMEKAIQLPLPSSYSQLSQPVDVWASAPTIPQPDMGGSGS